MTFFSRPTPVQTTEAIGRPLSQQAPHTYPNLQTMHDTQDRIFWCSLDVQGPRPSFTSDLLTDLQRVQSEISALVADKDATTNRAAVEWVVLGSKTPGVFSLGGDLGLFAALIAAGDRKGLTQYAYDCVGIAFRNSTGYGGGAISIGLAQGDALGGGFESLLSCDVLIAERKARFGLPEVLMGLFPGMGAHCFLTRRLNSATAMQMILAGEVLTAEALHKMGVVDHLAEDGHGEEAVRSYITRHKSRHRAHVAAFAARRVVSPVTLKTLHGVCDVWVDLALNLTAADLRRIAHMVAAQDRSRRHQTPHAVAAE